MDLSGGGGRFGPQGFYRQVAGRLSRGVKLYLGPGRKGPRYADYPGPGRKPLRPPTAAVYAGAGASHSWLWFADFLENFGFSKAVFVDENDVAEGALDRADAFLVSGGETFAMARGLGRAGKEAVEKLLGRGGLYWGACAGACMMMRSTTEPLGLFDLARVKIANLADTLPEPVTPSLKYSTPYGCSHVFHPVRDEVLLSLHGAPPVYGRGKLAAPLFGGPPMEPSEDVRALAVYSGFTSRTRYLASPEAARDILVSKVAVCAKRIGPGLLLLSGPHLEHPDYPAANALVADALYFSLPAEPPPEPKTSARPPDKKALKDFKREASNIRIAAEGLCRHADLHWKVGRKYYEPEKAAAYAAALWDRLLSLEKEPRPAGDPDLLLRAVETSRRTTEAVRELKALAD
ncbi:MAG: hypothetical protein JRI97_04630, partial [Deltaproteobacteria bacterium]|nr:hypothetical protein [Deltaproteobacteria bacterium]